jgi:hypothetical protein
MSATGNVNTLSKDIPIARYFSLGVYVLCRMENCTLTRFGDREFVVETQDLAFELGRAHAA